MFKSNKEWDTLIIPLSFVQKPDIKFTIKNALENKYKDNFGILSKIDIQDIDISETKTPDYKYVTVIYTF